MMTRKLTTRPYSGLIVAITLLIIVGCAGQTALNRLSAAELMAGGLERYDRERYNGAIEYFQQVLFNFPGYGGADSAQYFLAMSYFGGENYPIAQVEFNRLMLNYPASEFTTNAQFLRAVCYYEGTPGHYGLDQSDLNVAIRQFEDFIIDHPESEFATDAQAYIDEARDRLARKDYSAGVVYLRINALSAAEIYFQRVIDEYTSSTFAAEAAFFLAEIAEKKADFTLAAQRYRNFVAAYGSHRWAEKGTERQRKMLWEAAQTALLNGDLIRAEERLIEYQTAFPNDSRQAEIENLLRQIEKDQSAAAQVNVE